MNRRSFFQLAAGSLLATFVRPTPRREIDLMAFCRRPGERFASNFDLDLPWLHADWTYATDARVCVRVRPDAADKSEREGKMPPFGSLRWDHADLRGWKSLRPLDPILAEGECPACFDSGYAGGIVGTECEKCYGGGWPDCKGCRGKGHVSPGTPECRVCDGGRRRVFPCLVEVDGMHFDAALYGKAQQLGGEYTGGQLHAGDIIHSPGLKFRFAEGDGLLMPISVEAARNRIAAASSPS